MEEVILASITDEEFAKRLVKYLEYSEIPVRLEENEEIGEYVVFVPEIKKNLAGTHLSVFVHMEKQRAYGEFEEAEDEDDTEGEVGALGTEDDPDAEGDTDGEAAAWGTEDDPDAEGDTNGEVNVGGTEDDPDAPDAKDDTDVDNGDRKKRSSYAKASGSRPNVYTSREEVSKDMSQTAVTFFGFAAALVVITVLCALKVSVFAYFSNIIVFITLPLLAVGSVAVALNSRKRQKLAESEAKEENAQKDAIVTWLSENVTKELILENDDPEASLEVSYMDRTEFISKKLDEQFPGLDEVFREALVEEYYNRLF